MRQLLLVATMPFVVGTVIGLIVLWPRDAPSRSVLAGDVPDLVDATVVGREPGFCGVGTGGEAPADSGCLDITLLIQGGPDDGERASMVFSEGPGSAHLEVGDHIVVGRSADPTGTSYYFADFQRRTPLLLLAGLFVGAVVLLGRRRGFMALLSLGISLGILIKFVLPAILAGENPLAVAVVGSSAVMFVALYLTHGFTPQTTSAVLGTLTSLVAICVLGAVFVELSNFTGLATEEAGFLQLAAGDINLRGLLLAGLVIGSLGVLDDVTVTQASAVWQLHDANPSRGARDLFRSALEIGRDHIASTVNTLVLAYAGAALPLLILFVVAGPRLGNVITSEVVAEEVVRTLVGSVGLIASVPVTTALAALVVTHGDDGPPRRRRTPRPRAADSGPGNVEKHWRPPRREREFQSDEH
jgi:uncharacterized membrane protein